jgi:hypothetical protein
MQLKSITFFLFISFSVTALSQTANPFSKKSTSDSANSYERTVADGFIGCGFILGGDNTGAEVIYGQSREFIIGAGIGHRWIKWNAIGIDIYYKSTGFYLQQDSQKVLPNNALHQSEKISFDNLGGLVFDRFYFGSWFIDGGFYFDWTCYSKHITWDDYSFSYGSTVKTIEKQLNFVNANNYGLTFRGGSANTVSLYFNYRLSKLFKGASSSYIAYPELPVFVAGIIIGLHT